MEAQEQRLLISAGSIMASAFAIILAKKIGIKLYWKDLGLPFLIPIGVAFAFDFSQFIYRRYYQYGHRFIRSAYQN